MEWLSVLISAGVGVTTAWYMVAKGWSDEAAIICALLIYLIMRFETSED